MYSDLPELFWELVENGQGYGGFAVFVTQTPEYCLKDRDLFPFDAVYFQPEQAGDLDTGLSSSQILSSHVYKDFNIAKKYHPDCVIEVYRNDDIGEPYFVDNPVPRMS